MRINLLRAIEAEKSSVMAETDEDSRMFADRARQASDLVETERLELEPIIRTEHLAEESRLFEQFNICWQEFRRLDHIILDLAVQNTNLKAAALSRTEGFDAMDRFEKHLSFLITAHSTPGSCSPVPDMAYKALVAALKILSLHPTHIQEASDTQMDELERTMKAEEDIASANLASLSPLVRDSERDALSRATAAFDDFLKVTNELVRLSRANTNVKSLALSLGKKRVIALECEDALTALNEKVQSRTFKATR